MFYLNKERNIFQFFTLIKLVVILPCFHYGYKKYTVMLQYLELLDCKYKICYK